MLKLVSGCSLCLLTVSMIGCASTDHGDPATTNQDHPQGTTAPSQATPAPAATTPAAPAGPLSVVITSGTKEGFTVLFHDADGNVIGSAKTDATGTAVAPDAIAPAQVTALLGYDGFHKLVTWSAVARGDVLTVANVDKPAASDDVYFSVTPPGNYANATDYYASAPCWESDTENSNGTSPLSYGTCWSGTNAVIVQASAAAQGTVAFAFQKNVPMPTAPGTPITLSQWVPAQTMAVSAKDSSNRAASWSCSTGIDQDVGGTIYPATNTNALGGWEVAPGFADSYIARATCADSPPASNPSQVMPTRMIKQFVPAIADVTIDIATALPLMTGSTFDITDPQRPVVAWTGPDLRTSVDGGVARMNWGSGASSVGGGPIVYSPDSGSWDIYVAPDATSAKAPVLPAEAAAWLPMASTASGTVRFDDIDSVKSYAQYRQAIGGEATVLPQSTTVRTTSPGVLTL